MTLDNVKILLSITDESQDEIITILLTNAVNTICTYIGVDEMPDSLEYIAEELAVIKYRRLGAEGIDTEKIDVLSTKYVKDELSPFFSILDEYKNNKLYGKRLRTL